MNVAVFGTGSVGQQLARECALAGYDVALHGDDANAVMDCIDAIEHAVEDPTVRNHIDGTTDVESAVSDVELLFDTRELDLDTAQRSIATLESHADAETIIAVQAQMRSVTSMLAALRRPERGLGFATIDAASDVTEVVVSEHTGAGAYHHLMDVLDDVGHRPIPVLDSPGLVADRLMLALEIEAMRLVADGIASVASVDRTMEAGFGMAEGPLAFADRVGLDERLDAFEYLESYLGSRYAPPAILREKVDAGHLGQKRGNGFYEWDDGDPVIDDPLVLPEETVPFDPPDSR